MRDGSEVRVKFVKEFCETILTILFSATPIPEVEDTKVDASLRAIFGQRDMARCSRWRPSALQAHSTEGFALLQRCAATVPKIHQGIQDLQ